MSSPALAATITVTTASDDITPNDGSVALREAIAAINAGNNLGDPDITAENPGTFGSGDNIRFNIPGSSPVTIHVGTDAIASHIALPQLTNPATIDATTQAGTGTVRVVLDGTSAGATAVGLSLGAAATIKGFDIEHFSGDGILLASGASTISGNYIGVGPSGPTGATAAANGTGIVAASGGNTISGNTISGNTADGV